MMNTSPTIEIVMFKLKPDADEAAFLAASDAVLQDLRAASGFMRRELLQNDDGQWIDLVYWNSLEEAHHAAEMMPTWASAGAFISMLDEQSVTLLHLQRRREYH
jgi:heme-degrading monooxygenase HmoA